jgi:ATP-binding cassette subfamily B protein
MMAQGRSVLLNSPVSETLAPQLVREGVDPAGAWLCVQTDLNLAGQYQQVYLLVFDDRLVVAGPIDSDHPRAARVNLRRNLISEVRTRQGVGGGFVDAQTDGIWVEILAFSNSRADLFVRVAKKLQLWVAGQHVGVGAEDDVDPRKCPQCGLTLEFPGDICRRCVNRGAVFARVLKLMQPYAGKAVLIMVLVGVSISLAMIPPRLTRSLVDTVLAPEQAGNPVLDHPTALKWLLGLVGALLGTHLIGAVIGMLNGRLGSFVGTQIAYDMRKRVLEHLVHLEVAYYDRYNVGQLMARVAGDTEMFRGFVQQITHGFLAQLITLLFVGVMLFTLNWKLALYALLPAPLVFLAAMFFWKRIYPRYFRVWDASSRLHSTLNTILSGIRVVKAFAQEHREQNRFGRSSTYIRDSARGVEYSVSIFNPSIGLLFQLGGLIVWYAGGAMVLDAKAQAAHSGRTPAFTLGELMAVLGYLWMFYAPLTQLTQLTTWLTQFLTASQRTFEILDTPAQIIEAPQPVRLEQVKGRIVFERVSFGYHRREPVLKGIGFDVAPGEHIGVVGKSGSGKTTLTNLLARFYDVDEGRILIDGVDVRELSLDDLRKAVGVVLQEPFLFRGTIYDNITYGRRDVSPETVMAATKAANAHEFIMRYPLGYDTYIGERGAGLSGGERQRVSIARALLYDPPILVLDEATSSVDTESEQLIQQALARVTAGRTTITIAHRLSTLKNSDRILVMDSGQIIEMGTHEELMELRGLYYRLVKIQTELSREPSVDALAGGRRE